MTAGLAENISGRSQPRYHGEPVRHDVRWYGSERRGRGGNLGLIAECEPCDVRQWVDAGTDTAHLLRWERHHLGLEDP